jgi:hypothetical protein
LQVGVRQAIKIADRVLLLERGRVALQGPAGEMARRLDEIEAGHLSGGASAGTDRRSARRVSRAHSWLIASPMSAIASSIVSITFVSYSTCSV